MADITIRYLDERVLSALKRRAEARNRPLQAELREALRNQAAGLSVPAGGSKTRPYRSRANHVGAGLRPARKRPQS